MTRDETIELIKVMQAFADGKAVQRNPKQYGGVNNTWYDNLNPTWDPDYNWRVKPEPRIIWILIYPNGNVFCYESDKERAENIAKQHKCTIHEYREVLPGEST